MDNKGEGVDACDYSRHVAHSKAGVYDQQGAPAFASEVFSGSDFPAG